MITKNTNDTKNLLNPPLDPCYTISRKEEREGFVEAATEIKLGSSAYTKANVQVTKILLINQAIILH